MNIIQMVIAILEKMFTKNKKVKEENVDIEDKVKEENVDIEDKVKIENVDPKKVNETPKKVKLDTYLVGENEQLQKTLIILTKSSYLIKTIIIKY